MGSKKDKEQKNKVKWSHLLRQFTSEITEKKGKKIKHLRRQVIEAALNQLNVLEPTSEKKQQLETKFTEKLQACSHLKIVGKKVFLSSASETPPGPLSDDQKPSPGSPLEVPNPAESEKTARKKNKRRRDSSPERTVKEESGTGNVGEEKDEDEKCGKPRKITSSFDRSQFEDKRKTGPFSKDEIEKVTKAVEEYLISTGQDISDIGTLFRSRSDPVDKTAKAWLNIAMCLPYRSPKQIYYFASKYYRRGLGVKTTKGMKYTAEDDAELLRLVELHGKSWSKIGDIVGRTQFETQTHWRQLQYRSNRTKTGKWTEEETSKLLEIIKRVKPENPHNAENGDRWILDDIPWNVVSESMGSRNAIQCRQRWYEQLQGRSELVAKWTLDEEKQLIEGIVDCGASEEYDIPWHDLVPTKSEGDCKRQWRQLLCKVVNWKKKSFEDRLEGLLEYVA